MQSAGTVNRVTILTDRMGNPKASPSCLAVWYILCNNCSCMLLALCPPRFGVEPVL